MTTAVSSTTPGSTKIDELLGDEADALLGYTAAGIRGVDLNVPGPDFVERVLSGTDRSPQVLRNFQAILDHGRLAGTGYVSILPVDQGIEHSAGASFAPNPVYFDPANIVKLALEGGCNAVASTLGVLGACSRTYAHRIPFLVKLNHNELLTYPNTYDQIMFAGVEQAFELGAAAVGATIYFGSDESSRQIQEVSAAFARAHELGLVTVLWCYLRNSGFKVNGKDYHAAADLTGQANHLGATIEADIVKQKLPECNEGYKALNMGSSYQIANCYMGRVPLINSGGASGKNDFRDAVYTAVVNKRAGGMGLISGRKAFQRPMEEGVRLLGAIQDVYLDSRVTVA
jgi:class I fructose-bisphosphate aldolase